MNANTPEGMLRREEVLSLRARRLAGSDTQQEARRVAFDAVVVGVGAETWLLPARFLREVIASPPITPLGGTPSWLLGLGQVRGELLSFVDLGAFLGLASRLPSAGGAIPPLSTIVEGSQGAVGLVVDRVDRFRSIHTDELSTASDDRDGVSRPIEGVTRDLLPILDLQRLLEGGLLSTDGRSLDPED